MRKNDVRKHHPGIFATYKTLATGERRQYWYHRATRTRLPGEPGSPDFAKAYLDATDSKPKDSQLLSGLIRSFLASPFFAKRRPSTQKEYRRLLKAVEVRFGTMPIVALRSEKVRASSSTIRKRSGRTARARRITA